MGAALSAPSVRDGTMFGPVASVLRRLGAYVKEDAAAGTLEAVYQITSVTWKTDAVGGVVVSVTATGPVRAEDSVFHNPERLVVDLESAVIRLTDPDRAIGSGPVVGVRAAQFQVHPYVTRLVFDLASPLPHHVTTGPGLVTVVLGAEDQRTATASPGAPAAPGQAAGASSDATGAASAAVSQAPPTPGGTPPAAPSVTDQVAPLRDSRPPSSRADQAAPSPSAPLRDSRPPSPSVDQVPSPSPVPPGDSRPPAQSAVEAPSSPPAPLRDSRPPVAAGGGRPSVPSNAAHAPAANATPEAGASGAPSVLPAGSPEPLAPPPLPQFVDRPGAFHVNEVTYDEDAGRLVVHASQRFTYAVAQWVYPDRLAIDISGGVFLDRRKDVEVGTTAIRNVVVSQFNLRPNMTRILVHLNGKIAYTTASTDGGRTLTVTFGGTGARPVPGPGGAPRRAHGGHRSRPRR